MSKFMSERFDSLEEYVPGEQPQDRKYIKLNTNESPYAPSQRVIDAVCGEAKTLQLYPDPECKLLCAKLAEILGVKPQNVALGNGSDEILNFCFSAYCDSEKGVAFPEISYGFYIVFAQLYNLDYTAIPLKSDFSIDVNDYTSLDKTIVIANPNAPTGLSLTLDEIRKILDSNPDNIVVIDEAYVDFGAKSAVPLINEYDNLIVVGTFSKSRSLAGGRLGFAVANEQLIADIDKLRFSTNPYNINRLTLAAGLAALEDNDYYMDNCKKIIADREYTTAELKKRGFDVIDSKTNFVFAKCSESGGRELYQKLREKGVLVRHFDNPKISDYLRITIGSHDEMKSLIAAIDEILQ